jgi:glycine cleavage system H lipoate-binding protein/ABC-type phosphate transport system substrate-binding protein
MKTYFLLFIMLLFLFMDNNGWCKSSNSNKIISQSNTSGLQTFKVTSAPELKELVINWANEYSKVNPGQNIVFNDESNLGEGDIRFATEQNTDDKKEWKMVVGRDAIVPIINVKNPMLNDILRQGISSEDLLKQFTKGIEPNWESLIHNGQKIPVHFYISENESSENHIALFTGIKENSLKLTFEKTSASLIAAVERDIYSVGFCKLTDLFVPGKDQFKETIKLLPIDRNNNGRIDNFENIYNNPASFTRGIWIGKYPNTLCENIYAISSSKPTDQNALNFLSWINIEGQNYLNKYGFSFLASNVRKTNIEALSDQTEKIAEPENSTLSKTWIVTLLILVGLIIICAGIVAYAWNTKLFKTSQAIEITSAFDENSIQAPKGLYFDKSHTWAYMEKDGNVKIGLDDFMQHVTGTITRIKMKGPGEKIRKGEKFLSIIRNGKQLNIYSPVSGTIIYQNTELNADSSMINSSPYSEGWIYVIEPKNWLREIQFMQMAEKYKEWLQDEFIRLKDFLSNSVRSNENVYAHVILQDGGQLADHILADLDPEVWEDFQTNFIDTSK